MSREKFHINEEFENQITDHFKTNKLKTISGENVSRAYNMLAYFNKHKLALAGYEFDINSNIKTIFESLIEKAASAHESLTIQQQIANCFLLSNDSVIALNEINQRMSRKTNIAVIESVCKDLQKSGFGKLSKRSNSNGRATQTFVKDVVIDFQPSLINSIQDFGVDLLAFQRVNKALNKRRI